MATSKVRKTMYLSKQRATEVEIFAKNLGISESKFLAKLIDDYADGLSAERMAKRERFAQALDEWKEARDYDSYLRRNIATNINQMAKKINTYGVNNKQHKTDIFRLMGRLETIRMEVEQVNIVLNEFMLYIENKMMRLDAQQVGDVARKEDVKHGD